MKERRVLFNDILNTFYLQNICMNAWSDGIRVRWTDGWTGVLMEMDEWMNGFTNNGQTSKLFLFLTNGIK